MWERQTWLFLVAAVSIVAAACTSSSPEAERLEGAVWVLLPDDAESGRWVQDGRLLSEELTRENVEFQVVSADGDSQTQLRQAEEATAGGAKVMVLASVDAETGTAIISAAHDAGIKVIDYDRLTVGGAQADALVGFDYEGVGREMAEILAPEIDGVGDTPRVVMLNGGPSDISAVLFREGYRTVVEEKVAAGEWQLVADEWVPRWDTAEARVIFDGILDSAGGDVDAVFAASDGLANSVITVLEERGLPPILISGQDVTVGGVRNMLAGNQLMSVYKPQEPQARATARLAIALLNGEPVEPYTGETTVNNGSGDVPFVALDPIGITVEEIAHTVIADGFQTWDDICVGDFAILCPAAVR